MAHWITREHVNYQVKYANIACASSGENTLVAAVSGKQFVVLSMFVLAGGAVNVYLNTSGGAIMGDSTNKIQLAANAGYVLPLNEAGWCITAAANQALRINLSAAVAVAGCLTYIEV
jgi:hypothetical protein